MLTVEVNDPGKLAEGSSEIHIYCDREGLEELKRQLGFLERGATHVHLLSESWAGHELTEERQGGNTVLVHHLRIACIQSPDPP
jgi:hypothetical protein